MKKIESWITVLPLGVKGFVLAEDESTISLEIVASNMRGAMREVSHKLKGLGYLPGTRWISEAKDNCGNKLEVSRSWIFK